MTSASYTNGWRLSAHAMQRMDEMGLQSQEVLTAVLDPVLTYPGRPGENRNGTTRQVRVRGRVAVVVAPHAKVVITVLWHRQAQRIYVWQCNAV